MFKINQKLYYLLSFFVITLFLLNFAYFHIQLIYLLIGAIYLLWFSLFAGHFFFQKFHIYTKIVFGIMILFLGFIILGSASYYVYKLSNFLICLIIIILPIIFGLKLKKNPLIIKFSKIELNYRIILKIILIFVYLVLLFFALKYLIHQATFYSINTPWKMISERFFLLYIFLTFLMLCILYFCKSRFALVLISIHFFFSYSIILIIYKLGFGYDPFLHQASEKLMSISGTFLPKPPYYIGQYSLVVILSKMFNVSIVLYDKLLIPLFSAILLPTAIFQAIKSSFKLKSNLIFIATFLFLLIPFSNFTYTTPQALANLLFLTLIFLSIIFISKKTISIYTLFLLATAICFIHPMSGIPAILFVLILFLLQKNKKSIAIIFSILSCFVLPIFFYLYTKINKLDIGQLDTTNHQNLLSSFNIFHIFWPKFINFFDMAYIYFYNFNIFILILALIAIAYLILQKNIKNYFIYMLMFFILIINYLLTIYFVCFPFIDVFSERIFSLAIYCLFPLVFISIVLFLKNIFISSKKFKIIILIFLSIFISISFYLSYPRADKYENYHGYSISSSHQKAIDLIEKNFGKFDYIVLSDQSIGANLIKDYGFRKYYKDEFYYSLPTNIKNNIYSNFLGIFQNNSDKKNIVFDAMQKTGVNNAFVVINSFWSVSSQTLDELKKSANNWTDIDSGKIYIFEYKK